MVTRSIFTHLDRTRGISLPKRIVDPSSGLSLSAAGLGTISVHGYGSNYEWRLGIRLANNASRGESERKYGREDRLAKLEITIRRFTVYSTAIQ